MGLLAGFGVQLWPILQDLSQLQKHYPTSWSTFLANAGVVQAFGVADTMTAAWLSERLGQRTVGVRQQTMAGATIGAMGEHVYSQGHSTTARPLLTPDELMRLPADQQIVLLPGHAPVLADKLCYYKDSEFRGLYDPNPWIDGGVTSHDPSRAPAGAAVPAPRPDGGARQPLGSATPDGPAGPRPAGGR